MAENSLAIQKVTIFLFLNFVFFLVNESCGFIACFNYVTFARGLFNCFDFFRRPPTRFETRFPDRVPDRGNRPQIEAPDDDFTEEELNDLTALTQFNQVPFPSLRILKITISFARGLSKVLNAQLTFFVDPRRD